MLPGLSSALPGLSPALPGAPRLVVGTPRLVAGAPSHSEGRQECPPRVWYSPEIDASKFTLHILSDTPGGFQWLKYIVLMLCNTTHRLGDGRHVTLCQGVRGSVRAVRAVRNTRVFLMETRVVADAVHWLILLLARKWCYGFSLNRGNGTCIGSEDSIPIMLGIHNTKSRQMQVARSMVLSGISWVPRVDLIASEPCW